MILNEQSEDYYADKYVASVGQNIQLMFIIEDLKQRCDKALELLQLLHYKFPEYDSIHSDIEDIQKVLRGGINE